MVSATPANAARADSLSVAHIRQLERSCDRKQRVDDETVHLKSSLATELRMMMQANIQLYASLDLCQRLFFFKYC